MLLYKTDCISARTEEEENAALNNNPALDRSIEKFSDYLADVTKTVVHRVNTGDYKNLSPREDFTLELHSDDEETDAPDVMDLAIAIIRSAGLPLAVQENDVPVRARFTLNREETEATVVVYVEYTIDNNIFRTSSTPTRFRDKENILTVKKAMTRTGMYGMLFGERD